MSHVPVATIDFETRSCCDLKKSGSWRYSLDPTTEVLCLVWRLPHWDEGDTALWYPAFPHLGITEACADDDRRLVELFEWIEDGGLVEAHNAWFERGIWTNILVPRYGFLPIQQHQWRCSAAKAATHALPRKLEGATAALHLSIEKDMAGHDLMVKMCKPRKALKKERVAWAVKHAGCRTCSGKGKVKIGRTRATSCLTCGGLGYRADQSIPVMPTLWYESLEMVERLWDYCRVDVLAEEGLSLAIPDLNETETHVYLMDQKINERGFMLDRNAIEMALSLIEDESKRLTSELVTLTRGSVERATQRERMKSWFATKGLILENTQAAALDQVLLRPKLSYVVRRGLEIVRALGRSSTAKFHTMRAWICPDDRVRGGLLYHGAGTGRWAGAGVQPHNFPKGHIKKTTEGDDWNMDAAWDLIDQGEADEIAGLYGSVMEPLSQALRGTIVPSPGKHLYVADYAGIEARVLLWCAEDEDGLDVFRNGEDIYCSMASTIYGYPVTKAHKDERGLGKVAILGLGYQMGWRKFIESALKLGGIVLSEDMSQKTVNAYRTKFWRVKQMWDAQEQAAIEATLSPGERIVCGRMAWVVEDVFLYCILPSGRRLAYPFPRIRPKMTPWGDLKDTLTFKGVNPKTRQWHTQSLYGGLIVENQVQAVARDLMACALLRCEESEIYTPVLSVHDEMIAEADPKAGDVKVFEALMAENPEWADGCPVVAEGWSGVRYRK